METQIRKLLDIPIVGNAYHDSGLFALAHDIIMSPAATMAQKIVALRRADDAMGIGDKIDEEAVEEYILFFQELDA